MNLVISGPIDDTLRNLVVALSKPRNVVSLHARADRLEGVDDGSDTRLQVAALCDAARVDHAYIEEGIRFADFKLLAMDMDSTLITIECIDEIADFAGKKKEVAAITEAAMRGEITDFAESLRRRVALLAGTDVSVLQRVFVERVVISEGAVELIEAAKAAATRTLLLSGGFTYFSDLLRQKLSLNSSYANQLEIIDHKITGKLKGKIIDGAEKAKILSSNIRQINSSRRNTISIGDGANDIQMMKVSSHPIAYHAKPLTNMAAKYLIKHGSLRTVLDYFL